MNAQPSFTCLAAIDWPIFGATLLTALGEFLIVWAILSEVKGSRETNFLQTAFNKEFYAERAELYKTFLTYTPALGHNPKRQELWMKSRKFAEHALAELAVRKQCDSQITHLNQIAL